MGDVVCDTQEGRLPKYPGRPLLLPAMSDTPDRNDESRSTTQPAARGRLFDTTLYQAWASDAAGILIYLPVDAGPDSAAPSGESWREAVKAGTLHCPYPDCDAAFTGIRKGAGRVAFVHPKTGTTHNDKQAKETFWRLAAVETVRAWSATAYPGSTAVTADIDLAPAPDVLVTTADGDRLAVHLVYAALADKDWTAARDAYAEAGVTPLWLFANTGAYARKATGAADRLRPPAPVPAALADGAHVAWLNPFLGLVGTADAETEPAALAVSEVPVAEFTVALAPAAAEQPAADVEEPVAEDAAAETVAEPVAEAEPTADDAVAEPAAEVAEDVDADAETADAEKAESADAEKAEADDAIQVPVLDDAVDAPVLDADEPAATGADKDGEKHSRPTGTRPAETRPAGGPQRSGWLRRMIGRLRRPAA